jgi:hypothetical protein
MSISPTGDKALDEALRAAPRFLGGEDLPEEHDRHKYVMPVENIKDLEEPYLKPVYDAFVDLHTNIGGLNGKINDIVKRQSEDFMTAYKYEMQLIQKELKDIKKRYEEFM